MILKSSFLLLLPFVTILLSSSEVQGTTTIAPKTSTTPNTPAPTKLTQTCAQKNSSCSSCTDDAKCYWCSVDSTCKHYPASKIIPRDCKGNKWFWKQCFAAGYIVIIVIPSVCGAILLALGCCIYCCCCRSRGKKGYEREEERIRRRRDEARDRNAQRRADRKQRSDAIRQKYGLLNNDDNEVV